MYLHANAKLGLAGRLALVRAIEGGMTLKTAAAFRVSPATAHRWWHRWLEAGEEARHTLVLSVRSLEQTASIAAAARTGARAGDLRLPGLGAAWVGQLDRRWTCASTQRREPSTTRRWRARKREASLSTSPPRQRSRRQDDEPDRLAGRDAEERTHCVS
jgi:hypothetical protein